MNNSIHFIKVFRMKQIEFILIKILGKQISFLLEYLLAQVLMIGTCAQSRKLLNPSHYIYLAKTKAQDVPWTINITGHKTQLTIKRYHPPFPGLKHLCCIIKQRYNLLLVLRKNKAYTACTSYFSFTISKNFANIDNY